MGQKKVKAKRIDLDLVEKLVFLLHVFLSEQEQFFG